MSEDSIVKSLTLIIWVGLIIAFVIASLDGVILLQIIDGFTALIFGVTLVPKIIFNGAKGNG